MFAAASKTASSSAPSYIEDVFSTYLYTGNGTSQTITNGIDLSTKGGLVWCKNRASNLSGSEAHEWYDTVRGAGYAIFSNATSAQQNYGSSRGVTAFSTTGFTVTNSSTYIGPNADGITEVGWTFRKQPKFFDCVTWTSNGLSTQAVPHSLGVTPAFIVYKRLDSTSDWLVLAQNSSGSYYYLYLNRTDASPIAPMAAGTTGLTATTFNLNAIQGSSAGQQWVAYMFASNAGGFGLSGTDNVITCGSYTGNGSAAGPIVTLGYEPQWVLIKSADVAVGWYVADNMRGMSVGSADNFLQPNSSGSEFAFELISPTATGFQLTSTNTAVNENGIKYIYIAIRRGPMKTPTSGTSVFAPQATAGATDGTPNSNRFTSNFPIDLFITAYRAGSASAQQFQDRLRSPSQVFISSSTAAETSGNAARLDDMDGVYFTTTVGANSNIGSWMFRRAPGFMDVVCYTLGAALQQVNHNLGVTPELVIEKIRTVASDWTVHRPNQTNGPFGFLNQTAAFTNYGGTNLPATSTYFSALDSGVSPAIAYLFASCPGVSKVGTYTGTGATQTISCGFAARFVLIKRTDSTGDWWVWDTARGMVAGTDPRLALNLTSAETNANWVYTDASGFQIVTTDATVNASGGTYIYLAIS